MNMDLDKRFMEAMTRTLHNYEELMADVPANKKKWKYYGNTRACLMCRIFSGWDCRDPKTGTNCVLLGIGQFCCSSGKMCDLITAIETNNNNKSIKAAAKARYDELITHIKGLGYDY